jgi:hypothetical protein
METDTVNSFPVVRFMKGAGRRDTPGHILSSTTPKGS